MNNDTIKGIRVSSVVGAASISQPQCRQEITGWPSRGKEVGSFRKSIVVFLNAKDGKCWTGRVQQVRLVCGSVARSAGRGHC